MYILYLPVVVSICYTVGGGGHDAGENRGTKKKHKKKYMSKFVRLEFRTTAEQRDIIQAHAAALGESVSMFINRAITEAMAHEGGEKGGN